MDYQCATIEDKDNLIEVGQEKKYNDKRGEWKERDTIVDTQNNYDHFLKGTGGFRAVGEMECSPKDGVEYGLSKFWWYPQTKKKIINNMPHEKGWAWNEPRKGSDKPLFFNNQCKGTIRRDYMGRRRAPSHR